MLRITERAIKYISGLVIFLLHSYYRIGYIASTVNETATKQETTMNTTFTLNQIVKGHKAGTFVIVGFRMIENEEYAQVMSYCPIRDKVSPGEFALPLTALVAIN